MEVVHRCRTFSIIANLNKLESFILHDPEAQRLYKQYLALEFPESRKANHVSFFAEIVQLGERGNCSKGNPAFRAELHAVFETYFEASSVMLLDISDERLSQVRRSMKKDITLSAFKPAIKEVVRDLAFIHMDSFVNSAVFKDFRDNMLEFDLAAIPSSSVQEKDSTHKLRKFFGDSFLHTGSSVKLLGEQPKHIKEYKLSKLFGERVGVEKVALLEDQEDMIETEEQLAGQLRKRNRRLHTFFGDNFEVEDTIFSERIQVAQSAAGARDIPKQPEHVNSFRLAKFFGLRPPSVEDFDDSSSGSGSDGDGVDAEDSGTTKRLHSKNQHLMRFFGERMDLTKEANAVNFAAQPEHVKACTLKKIFGESAAHTINFDVDCGGTWPKAKSQKSRAKLEKFFGPFQG